MYKKIFQGKKAATFDLDGTLVKTAPFWNQAFESVCSGTLLNWPGFDGLAGLGLEVIWDRLLTSQPDADVKLTIADLAKKTEQKFLHLILESDVEASEGFWDLAYELKEEKGFKLGLVSNSSKEVVQQVLSKIGITQTFDVVLTKSDVKKAKPHPDIYKLAAKQLGVSSKNVVSFEDSPAGAESAVKAGCTVVVIYNGDFPEVEYPKKTATMIAGFTDVVGRMDLTFREVIQKTAEQLEKEQGQES